MSNYLQDAIEDFQRECKRLHSALDDWGNEFEIFADDPAIEEYVESKDIDLEPLAALWNEYMFGGLGEALEAFIALDPTEDD